MSLLIKALKEAELRHQDAAAKALDEAASDPSWASSMADGASPPPAGSGFESASVRPEPPSHEAEQESASPLALAPQDDERSLPTLSLASDADLPGTAPTATAATHPSATWANQVIDPSRLDAATEAETDRAFLLGQPRHTPSATLPEPRHTNPPPAATTPTPHRTVRPAAPQPAPPPPVAEISPPAQQPARWRRWGPRTLLALMLGGASVGGGLWLASRSAWLPIIQASDVPAPEPLATERLASAQADAAITPAPETPALTAPTAAAPQPAERPNGQARAAAPLPTVRPDLAVTGTTNDGPRASWTEGQGVLTGRLARTPAAVPPPVRPTERSLDDAYAALRRHDYPTARQAYGRILAIDPLNVDALVGMAAIAANEGRRHEAERTYQQILEIDPHHSAAQAGLASLRVAVDPRGQESRLRHLIADDATQPALHFALGNSLAAQGRWSEAQQAYFTALRGDETHPDYAFNLAISLEWLRTPQIALQFYQRALSLAEQRPARFDPQTVRQRIASLSAAAPNPPAQTPTPGD